MSLEHMFRNINDIRIFDELSSDMIDKEHALDIDEIMNLLELPQREEIQIRDSIEHLLRQEIIGVTHSVEKYYLLPNKLNSLLNSAIMESSFMFAERLTNDELIKCQKL